MYAWLTNTSALYAFGSLVTLICVFISARFALGFLRHSPRLFTVMALFACSWMLVLGAYDATEERHLADLTSDLAAFLDIYIGGLLILEYPKYRENPVPNISLLQVLAIWLLLFIAVPRGITFPPAIEQLVGVPGLAVNQTKLVASLCLVLIGFASIALAVHAISSRTSFLVIVAILIFYSFAEVARVVDVWFDDPPKSMTAEFILSFAVAKLALTSVFGFIVVRHRYDALSESQPTISYLLRRFFFLVPVSAP